MSLHKLKPKYAIPWSVLIDANGRTGSIESPAIGLSLPTAENDNGRLLRSFAKCRDLVLANTNEFHLQDAHRCERFQQLHCDPPDNIEFLHIHDHLQAINDYIKWAAAVCFGSPKDQPMKKMISAETLSVIKCIAPLRRSRHTCGVRETLAFKRCALCVAAELPFC